MAETGMVERVAAAICKAIPFGVDQVDAAKAARAAIEAMREPTEAVLNAVQTEIDIWPDDRPKPSPNAVEFVSRDEADSIWRAGIDAILKEE